MIILKNKIKVVMIFVFSAVILTLGISVAYYNTCSLAFDGEPVIACVNDEKITFLDFSVSRKELRKIKMKLKKQYPTEQSICKLYTIIYSTA